VHSLKDEQQYKKLPVEETMNKTTFLLIVLMLITLTSMFALTGAVRFIDAAASPLTKAVLDIEAVPLLGAGYTVTFPTSANRWRYQYYRDGGDGIISPLDANGAPTGDDLIATATNAYTTGTVALSPGNVWQPTAAIFAEYPGTGNTYIPTAGGYTGDKVFLRIFNANTIALATKSIAFTALYTLTTATTQTIQPYIPAYGWSNWELISPLTLNPAVIVSPANGAVGVSNTGVDLTWSAGTGIVPTGYKVYFGTDTPPTNIVNGTIQTGTTYSTGALLNSQLYYWKIVPIADTLEAADCPIWAFSTTLEINPDPAINPSPATGTTVYSETFPYNQTLSWSPATTGQAPTGYKLYWNGSITAEDLGNVLTVSKNIPAAGPYTWKIVPYYVEPTTRKVTTGRAVPVYLNKSRTNSRGDAINCPTWTFTAAMTQYYTVDITSAPTGAAIYVNGVNSGFTTPHQFSMVQFSSATYTVQMAGYTWVPTSFVVTNIQSNQTRNFVGTLQTFSVLIGSTPVDADIYVNGVDSGFNTPYNFTMNYGTSATYTVQKPGYTWAPAQFVVTNITANANQTFVGTIMTYTVDITSTPTGAAIYKDAVNTGFTTPHQFVMNYGTSGTYTVQMAGYTWAPTSLVVTNIAANTSQNFVGTLMTYTVDITSTPAGAAIYKNAVDTGFTTPHQFVMNYGTSGTYTVQMAGYTWAPTNFVVTNIMANTSQNFVGTIITYTVNITSTPTDADIYVDGVDSGFNTPHIFTMNYGTSATYTVQRVNCSGWTPTNFVVTNIMANTSQNFVGTIITYTVDITSAPTDSDIYVNGIDSGFNTPHQFVLDYGMSATYTVQMAGYTWAPANFVVTNITANTSQNFVGTILTYTVDITSTPTGAAIYKDAVDTGFTTPHQFVMNYGTSGTYTVQMAGYTWVPVDFVVTNIMANTSQNFVGTLMDYTVDITSTPTNADIYVDGVDSGFNTPYQFIMNYGAGATFTVQMAGYIFTPDIFVVTNIMANTSQEFTGTAIYVTVTPDSGEVSADAGTADFSIDSNYDWAISEFTPWFSVSPMTGTGAGTFTVTYEENTSPIARTAIITVTAGTVIQTIPFTQLGVVGNDDEVELPYPMISVYPNPFAGSTNIRLHVKDGIDASLDVYSIKGQHVKTLGSYKKGNHEIVWNGKDEKGKTCSSGFYFIRYKSAEANKTVKVLLMQ